MKRICLISFSFILFILSIQNLSAATNTVTLTVNCLSPLLDPNDGTVYLGSIVARGHSDLQVPVGGSLSSIVTFSGQGNHSWTINVVRWDQNAPGGTGPQAYIESHWSKSEDNGTTWSDIGLTGTGSFTLHPTDDACNAEAKIKLTITRAAADANFPKTLYVPFVFLLSYTF
jgi:hypothetical protein